MIQVLISLFKAIDEVETLFRECHKDLVTVPKRDDWSSLAFVDNGMVGLTKSKWSNFIDR